MSRQGPRILSNNSPEYLVMMLHLLLDKLRNLQPDQSLNIVHNVCVEIPSVNPVFWNIRLPQSSSLFSGITFLHAYVLLLIDEQLCPNPNARELLLQQLIEHAPVEAWETRPLLDNDNPPANKRLQMSPRDCVFDRLTQDASCLHLFTALLQRIPHERWAPDFTNYALFIFTHLAQDQALITQAWFHFLEILAKNNCIHAEIWFSAWFLIPSATAAQAEIPPTCMHLITLLINSIKQVFQNMEARFAAVSQIVTFESFISLPESIGLRQIGMTLLTALHHIVKRSRADHWMPRSDATSNMQSPLNDLINLLLISKDPIVSKMVEYVVSIAPREAHSMVSQETIEEIAKHDEWSEIKSMLIGGERHAVDLKENVFALLEDLENRSLKSFFIVQVLTPGQYIVRLRKMPEDKIMHEVQVHFPKLIVGRSMEYLTHSDCPADFHGMTLLQAATAIFIQKLSSTPEHLSSVLLHLYDLVPHPAWMMPTISCASNPNAKEITHSNAYHGVQFLCRGENGYQYFPVLQRILSAQDHQDWHADIPGYFEVLMKVFLTQGVNLTLPVAQFFDFLVAQLPTKNIFFTQMSFTTKEKSKNKNTLSATLLPICTVITTFYQILDAAFRAEKPYCAIVCTALTNSLKMIVESSQLEDWGPTFKMDGTDDSHKPLNELVKLFLLDTENPHLRDIFKRVLETATQDALKSIAKENREKLLAQKEFSKDKKLVTVFCEKKPVPKKSGAAPAAASKPSPKKPAQTTASAPAAKCAATVNAKPKQKPSKKPAAKKPSAESTAEIDEKAAEDVFSQLAVSNAIVPQDVFSQPVVVEVQSDKSLKMSEEDDEGILVPQDLPRPTLNSRRWCDDAVERYIHHPYSFFYNNRVLVMKKEESRDVVCDTGQPH